MFALVWDLSLTEHAAAGFKAIFLSVDVPVLGQRLNEHRNQFILPEGLTWPNLTATGEGLEFGE